MKIKITQLLGGIVKDIVHIVKSKGGCHKFLREKRCGSSHKQYRSEKVVLVRLSILHYKVTPKLHVSQSLPLMEKYMDKQ